MISKITLDRMVKKIHSFPELNGCLVGFQGNGQSQVLNPGFSATPNSARVMVVIEELYIDDATIIAETQRWAATQGGSPEKAPNPTVVTNRSKLGPELLGAGISCGLTIVSGIGIVGGVVGELPSGGTSTFLIIASWTGLATQGIQCINGLARIAAIASDPDDNTLQRWDDNDYYKGAMMFVDALGIATSVATLPNSVRKILAVMARQRSFAARRLTPEALKAMNRADRQRIVKELISEAIKSPEDRAALQAAMKEAQIGSKSIQGSSGLSVRNATKMVRIIGDDTARRLSRDLIDIVGETINIGTNALPEKYVGSASGTINWVINLIDGQKEEGAQAAH